jgi:hypothetical protein
VRQREVEAASKKKIVILWTDSTIDEIVKKSG